MPSSAGKKKSEDSQLGGEALALGLDEPLRIHLHLGRLKAMNLRVRLAAFFFKDAAAPEIYTSVNPLSLHDALPILFVEPRGRYDRVHHCLAEFDETMM